MFELAHEGNPALSEALPSAGRGKASSRPLPRTATYRKPLGTARLPGTSAAEVTAADTSALSVDIASAFADECRLAAGRLMSSHGRG